MQSCYLFLVFAVAAVSSEVIDINNATDISFAKANEILRQRGITFAHLPPGHFGTNISFSDSLVLGVDSLQRTDDCTITVEGSNTTFDYHYGWALYQQVFKSLRIDGNVLSAGYRIRDNSVHLAFTIHNDTSCYVTLDDISYERLAKVEFYASRQEYDGIAVDDVFEEVVLPFLNKKINRAGIQHGLQAICKHHPRDFEEQMPLVHMSITQSVRNVY